jgi:hypothetical protein
MDVCVVENKDTDMRERAYKKGAYMRGSCG